MTIRTPFKNFWPSTANRSEMMYDGKKQHYMAAITDGNQPSRSQTTSAVSQTPFLRADLLSAARLAIPKPSGSIRYRSSSRDDHDLCAYQKDVVLGFLRPGKPTDNVFIESFNGKFRAECLNTHWFMSLDDARAKMESWRRDYNEVRPHNAIGHKTPIELMKRSEGSLPV